MVNSYYAYDTTIAATAIYLPNCSVFAKNVILTIILFIMFIVRIVYPNVLLIVEHLGYITVSVRNIFIVGQIHYYYDYYYDYYL